MDELRYKRYIDKITYIQDKLHNFKPIPASVLEKDGILYGVQSSIEATMDTISMVIKDLGRNVKADKENIEFLVKNNFIPNELGEF